MKVLKVLKVLKEMKPPSASLRFYASSGAARSDL